MLLSQCDPAPEIWLPALGVRQEREPAPRRPWSGGPAVLPNAITSGATIALLESVDRRG
jgi:hypothetical protein